MRKAPFLYLSNSPGVSHHFCLSDSPKIAVYFYRPASNRVLFMHTKQIRCCSVVQSAASSSQRGTEVSDPSTLRCLSCSETLAGGGFLTSVQVFYPSVGRSIGGLCNCKVAIFGGAPIYLYQCASIFSNSGCHGDLPT